MSFATNTAPFGSFDTGARAAPSRCVRRDHRPFQQRYQERFPQHADGTS